MARSRSRQITLVKWPTANGIKRNNENSRVMLRAVTQPTSTTTTIATSTSKGGGQGGPHPA